MKYIKNDCLNAYFNLALEEYILKNFLEDDYILLWQNDNSIIVGRHQNTIEEINPIGVKKHGVKVVRRITGGGAVYHDLGNLNFSFISNWSKENDLIYERFLSPVIRGLKEIGINAYKKGRNDLVIDDKKFSGNAQVIFKNRILHHGTILFNSNLSLIQELLNIDKEKIASKGVKSVMSRVTNIKEYANQDVTIEFLKHVLLKSFSKEEDFKTIELTDVQLDEVKKIAKEKYETWEWNYGNSINSTYTNSKRFENGKIEVKMVIENGLINECKIYGDFLSLKNVDDIESLLIGKKYDIDTIKEILDGFNLKLYFGEISPKDILQCFI